MATATTKIFFKEFNFVWRHTITLRAEFSMECIFEETYLNET